MSDDYNKIVPAALAIQDFRHHIGVMIDLGTTMARKILAGRNAKPELTPDDIRRIR